MTSLPGRCARVLELTEPEPEPEPELETNGFRIDKNTKTNTLTTGMDYNWAGVIWKCGEINATRSMLWKMIGVLSVDFAFPYIISPHIALIWLI